MSWRVGRRSCFANYHDAVSGQDISSDSYNFEPSATMHIKADNIPHMLSQSDIAHLICAVKLQLSKIPVNGGSS